MQLREAIKLHLEHHVADSPFLIPRWSTKLETQIMVKKGIEEVEPKVYTADGETWSNSRWPFKAGTDPYYKDRPITYDPEKRISRIGSTGWNWEDKRSVFVGIDIDAEDSGHAAGTNTVDEFQLGQIVAKLSELPYISLVRSTGGKGIHGYVYFDQSDAPVTENHNEHTQVALAVLEKIREDTGMDLVQEKIVDVKGVVLWFWSCDSGPTHPGFTVVHEGTQLLKNSDIPEWDKVVPKKKVKNDQHDYTQCELEPDHLEILAQLEDLGYAYSFNEEFNTAQTHTFALKILYEKRKAEGNPVRGIYQTLSKGTDPSCPNCYITAKPGGFFKVARFGNATSEHKTWFTKDDDTWTFFNQPVDPMSVFARYAITHDMSSAILDPASFGEVLALLECDFDFPEEQIKVVYDSSANAIIAHARYREDNPVPSGWTKVGKKITARLPLDGNQETRANNYLDDIDQQFRFVIAPSNEPFGWFHKSASRGWVKYEASGHIARLVSQQFGKTALDEIVAMMQNYPWMLGNCPFGPEILPNREWNRCTATFACDPADHPGPHVHFDKIFDHLGKGLDLAVANADWAGEWGLESGADYLRYWVASAVKYPFEPLPYLFFFGPQGCGKSIFIEMLRFLFPGSVGDISGAILSEAGFNAEATGKVFCYLEEKDLTGKGQAQRAYERIKEWTMAKEVLIHPKGKTPYMAANTMKFVHMANQINSLRIDRDDTRVVAVDVPKLMDPIPKSIMEARLQEEVPQFLRTILTTEIPPAVERCRVPHINTLAKMELGEANMSMVQRFAQTTLKPCPGNLIEFSEFKQRFDKFCEEKRVPIMGQNAISSELRKMEDLLVLGKHGKNNKVHLGNIKFEGTKGNPGKKLSLQENGRLG